MKTAKNQFRKATKNQFNHVSQIMNTISFRKFGNSFRKNINPKFKAEYNTISVGGMVSASFPWSDVASYIIGDHSYSMTQNQYNNFCKNLGIKAK